MQNNPNVWNANDLKHALTLVAGPEPTHQESEHIYIVNKLIQFIKNGSRVLEFGCGYGRILKYFKQKYPDAKFYGVDFNKNMISLGMSHCADMDINLVYLNNQRDILKLGKFDFIFSHAVMIHNDSNGISEIFKYFKQILNKQGVMVHDFLMNTTEAIQETQKVKDHFPLFCYSEKDLFDLSNKHGYHLSVLGDKRMRTDYIFRLDNGQ